MLLASDDIRTNLINSYDRIITFAQKHLPDPFYTEGTQRISVRDKIFREIASNILIHRDLRNAFPAKIIIESHLLLKLKYNSIQDARAILGDVNKIREIFTGFQKYLYNVV